MVTAADAFVPQPVGNLVGVGGELLESAAGGGAILFHNDQRGVGARGGVFGDFIDPVQRKVELCEAGPDKFALGPSII